MASHPQMCSCCHQFCENTDPKKILKDDSSDREDDINDEEEENNKQLLTHLCKLSFGGFSL